MGGDYRAWGGPGKEQKGEHWIVEMLTGMELTQLYIFVQAHLTEMLRSAYVILYKLYFR